MKMFLRYLCEVLNTGWGILFLIAGGVSTCVTFVLIYNPQFALPYWIPGAISIGAWLFAQYRLYDKQQQQIGVLTASQQQPRRAKLIVLEEQGSYFIRRSAPQNSTPRAEVGIYLELLVSIENKGERSAIITSYSLHIEEMGDFANLRPSPQSWVLGMRAQHAIDPKDAVKAYVEVPPEGLAAHQRIPFVLDALAPGSVTQIRCELTLKDTEGNSASTWLTAINRG
jgi:hypothetical protein